MGNAGDQGFISEVMGQDEIWENRSAKRIVDMTKEPAGSLWSRLTIPYLQDGSSAIRFENIKGTHIVIYLEDRKIYENYHYNYDNNAVLLPLSAENSGNTLYVWAQNERGWLGIQGDVQVGPYAMLQEKYLHNGLMDIILGSTLYLHRSLC